MKSTVMYKLIFIILSCKGMDTKRTCNNISECFALLLLVHMDKKKIKILNLVPFFWRVSGSNNAKYN